MNATQKMQKVVEIQCNVAALSILIFIARGLYSFLTGILILPMIVVWWIGIRLIIGYENISRGRVDTSQTRKFWFGSLVFNVVGVIFGALFLIRFSVSLEYCLGLVPGLLSSCIAIMALLLPTQTVQHLEHQIS